MVNIFALIRLLKLDLMERTEHYPGILNFELSAMSPFDSGLAFLGGVNMLKGRKNIDGHFVARDHMVARTAG